MRFRLLMLLPHCQMCVHARADVPCGSVSECKVQVWVCAPLFAGPPPRTGYVLVYSKPVLEQGRTAGGTHNAVTHVPQSAAFVASGRRGISSVPETHGTMDRHAARPGASPEVGRRDCSVVVEMGRPPSKTFSQRPHKMGRRGSRMARRIVPMFRASIAMVPRRPRPPSPWSKNHRMYSAPVGRPFPRHMQQDMWRRKAMAGNSPRQRYMGCNGGGFCTGTHRN